MELFHASSPRSGTSQDSFHGCLAPFIEHLKQEGLTEGRIRCLRASARHFLVWLGQEDIDIGVIDDAVLRRFRRHDCRCRRMERERRKMLAGRSRQFASGALRPRPRKHPEYGDLPAQRPDREARRTRSKAPSGDQKGFVQGGTGPVARDPEGRPRPIVMESDSGLAGRVRRAGAAPALH